MSSLTDEERRAIADRVSFDVNPGKYPNKMTPDQRADACRRWLCGESYAVIGKDYGVRASTIAYHVRRVARGVAGG